MFLQVQLGKSRHTEKGLIKTESIAMNAPNSVEIELTAGYVDIFGNRNALRFIEYW